MTANIVYQIDCQEQECQDARDHPDPDASPRRSSYFGQSGRSMHARAAEHAAGLRNQNPACPLTKHALEYHANDPTLPQHKMKLLKVCKGNVARLLTESQTIEDQDDAILLNSKTEYGKNKPVRFSQ